MDNSNRRMIYIKPQTSMTEEVLLIMIWKVIEQYEFKEITPEVFKSTILELFEYYGSLLFSDVLNTELSELLTDNLDSYYINYISLCIADYDFTDVCF